MFVVGLKSACEPDDLGELGLFGLHSMRVFCRVSSFSVSVRLLSVCLPRSCLSFFFYYPLLVFIDFVVYLSVFVFVLVLLDFCRS